MPTDWAQIAKYGIEAIQTGIEGAKAAGDAAPGLPFGGGSSGPGGFQQITPTSQPLGAKAGPMPGSGMGVAKNALQKPGGGVGIPGSAISALTGGGGGGMGLIDLIGGLFGGKKKGA